MINTNYPIPTEEFNAIYARVPRLSVELIIIDESGILLTKRAIEPALGQWHFPGGTVLYGETLPQAVKRVAMYELGVEVEVGQVLGYVHYPDLEADGYKGWPVGIAFAITIIGGSLRGSDQGEEIGHFHELPDNTLSDQARFITEKTLLK